MQTYVGITNKCNAKCFTCNRQVLNNYRYNDDMSMNTIAKILEGSEKITYIGEMGDFIFHKHSLEIARMTIEDFKIPMNVDTIGNINGDEYWSRLGSLIKGDSFVRFTIDSLESIDPHRCIDNTRVLKNLEIFINSGGNAKIKTILFNFNKDKISIMADHFRSMGANEYHVIKSRLYQDEGDLAYHEKSTLEIMNSLEPKAPDYCPWHKHDMVYINEFGELKVCCHLVFEGITNADSIDPSIEQYIGAPMYNDIIELYKKNRRLLNLNNHDVTIESAYNNEFNQFMIKNFKKIKICKFRCGITESLQNLVFYERKIF